MELKELQKQVDTWIRSVGVRYYSELTNLGILMEEVGELARLMVRKYGDQSFKKEAKHKELAEEFADILFVLIALANQTGVDLEKAFQEKMKKRTQRDAERHKNNPKLSK